MYWICTVEVLKIIFNTFKYPNLSMTKEVKVRHCYQTLGN